MGLSQGIQSPLGKVGILPAKMIPADTASFPFMASSQDAPQSHADPSIQWLERASLAVFEILKPATARVPVAEYSMPQPDGAGACG